MQLLRERVRLLQESNEQLAQRNDQVTLSFRQVRHNLIHFNIFLASSNVDEFVVAHVIALISS